MMLHRNFEFISNDYVKQAVINTVIECSIKYKHDISAREFLNFIADILIPIHDQQLHELTDLEKIEMYLPNLLFNSKEKSTLLYMANQLDPIHIRSEITDDLLIKVNTLTNLKELVEKSIADHKIKDIIYPFTADEPLTDHFQMYFVDSFIRTLYLVDIKYNNAIRDEVFIDFVRKNYCFNNIQDTDSSAHIMSVYEIVKDSVYKWLGSPLENYVYYESNDTMYKLAQKLQMNESVDHLRGECNSTREFIDSFTDVLVVVFKQENEIVTLEIDFSLYKLLLKIVNGYKPNKEDIENATQFVEFIERLMDYGDKEKEVLIHNLVENKMFFLEKDLFNNYAFEEV